MTKTLLVDWATQFRLGAGGVGDLPVARKAAQRQCQDVGGTEPADLYGGKEQLINNHKP